MISELKDLFGAWSSAVAAGIRAVTARIVPRPRILFVEGEGFGFTARVTSAGKGGLLPPASFRLVQGRPEPALPPEWQAALRGSRIDILMRPDQVLFRAVDFPKQATDFLDGMIRAQIDRLTPWTAGEAVFGITPPAPIANERIALTLAATSTQKIQPLVKLATDFGAASVAGLVEVPAAVRDAEPVTVFERPLTRAASAAIDAPILLRLTLLGAALAAAASLAIAAYVGSMLDAEQQELPRQNRAAPRSAADRSDLVDRPRRCWRSASRRRLRASWCWRRSRACCPTAPT